MRKHLSRYISKNGIQFHHVITTAELVPHIHFGAESHSLIELLFLISGKVDYMIDGETYHVSPGDVIVVNEMELHSLYADPNLPYERIVLQFSPNFIPKSLNYDLFEPFTHSSKYQHILPRSLVERIGLSKAFKNLTNLAVIDSKFKDAYIISAIIDIIAKINESVEILLTDSYHMISTPRKTNELLHSIIEYISDHITDTITAVDIANFTGISTSYLYRFFQKNMNISLQNYIQNQKMQLARSLILKGHQPKNVAEKLGYEYYSTFFAHFKKIFKKTPTQLYTKFD